MSRQRLGQRLVSLSRVARPHRTMSFKQWLYQTSLANRRLAPRRPAEGLAAGCRTPSGRRQYPIRDISATGLFLLTADRWEPGTALSLLLHPATSLEPCVPMPARVARNAHDGLALAFDLAGTEPALWIRLFEAAANHASADYLISRFKMTRALAFLTRICPSNATAVLQRLRTHLTGQRLWNAIEIVLKAECLVTSAGESAIVACDASLIRRILEEGSWTAEQIMADCWASLLATACLPESAGDSHSTLVELFAQLTHAHYRVLSAASAQATKYLADSGDVVVCPHSATADQIMRFSDTRDLLRMGRTLEHLSELGLLEERFKTSMFVPVDSINITPTLRGLLLYARCIGHSGTITSLFSLTPAVEIAAAG